MTIATFQLSEVAELITKGTTPPKSMGGFSDAGINYIKSESLSYSGAVDISNLVKVSPEVHQKLKRSQLKEDDILYSIAGANLGKCGIVPSEILPANTNQAVAIIRLDKTKADARFVSFFLRNPRFVRSVLAGVAQSAQPNVNLADIGRYELPALGLPQQKAIGDALGALDDKIELNRRMNEALEEMARALFQDWFVDFGPTRRQADGATDPAAIMGHALPPKKAATVAPLFTAKLGDDGLPEGWKKRILYDLTDWVNGAAYKNMHFSTEPNALPVIKIAELKAGVTKTTKHTNTALGDKFRIVNGEVLFSWSGNPDTSIDTFIWSGGDAWLNQHIFAVRPNGEVEQSVLYFLLKYLRPQFAEIARDKQTTGLGHVTKQDLKSMRICLGSDEVENAATEIFSPLFAKLYANQEENQTLANMRDLLLPKLMSGEIRLKDAEALL